MGNEKKKSSGTRASVLHSQSLDELKASAAQLQEQLFKMKMQHSTGQLANTASIGIARKELARIKTIETLKTMKTAK